MTMKLLKRLRLAKAGRSRETILKILSFIPIGTGKAQLKPIAERVSLSNLAKDVVVIILLLCSIPDVLAISQTCRHLYSLAFSRPVWFALVSDLHTRQFIDLRSNEHLGALSTAHLIALVKRAVTGPISWSSSYPSPPVILHRQALKLPVGSLPHSPGLLPGGRYLLCQTAASTVTVTCWNLEERRIVWRYQGNWKCKFRVSCFAADVTDNGRSVVIVIGLHLQRDEVPKDFVDIVRVDLLKGTSRSLVLAHAPDVSDPEFFDPRICGDFATMMIRSTPRKVLLINLLTHARTVLWFAKLVHGLDLVPGYLIVLQEHPLVQSAIMWVWDVQSFAGRSVCYLANAYVGCFETETMVPPILSDYYDTNFVNSAKVSAHLSPLRDGVYTIWTMVQSSDGGCVNEFMITRSYHLLLDPSQPRLLVRSSTSGPRYGGYGLTSDNISHTGCWDEIEPGGLNGRPLSDIKEVCGHMSAYSGAITYVVKNRVLVDYYL